MRRSRAIVLVLSGALATGLGPAGCNRPPNVKDAAAADQAAKDAPEQDNNTYTPGLGYYHSPFGAWYPFPFNFFQSGRGYFYGGNWHEQRFTGPVPMRSRPSPAGWSAARSAFRGSTGGNVSPGSSTSPSSVIRGGFGSSSHFSGS
ncbi:MAG: hypothetical protein ABIZ04_04785 [Opitutus sp.]